MKKLLFLFLLVGIFASVQSQSLLRPVSPTLFKDLKASQTIVPGNLKVSEIALKWIPRFSTGVIGESFGSGNYHEALDAIGFGIGILRYNNIEGEAPFNDIGFNLLYLKNTKNSGSGIGIYFTYNVQNTNSLLNIGTHYDFFLKKELFDVGVTFHY